MFLKLMYIFLSFFKALTIFDPCNIIRILTLLQITSAKNFERMAKTPLFLFFYNNNHNNIKIDYDYDFKVR